MRSMKPTNGKPNMNKLLKKILPMFLWNFYATLYIKELRRTGMKYYLHYWLWVLGIIVTTPIWIWGAVVAILNMLTEWLMGKYETYILGYPLKPIVKLERKVRDLREKSFSEMKPEEVRKRLGMD